MSSLILIALFLYSRQWDFLVCEKLWHYKGILCFVLEENGDLGLLKTASRKATWGWKERTQGAWSSCCCHLAVREAGKEAIGSSRPQVTCFCQCSLECIPSHFSFWEKPPVISYPPPSSDGSAGSCLQECSSHTSQGGRCGNSQWPCFKWYFVIPFSDTRESSV